MHFTILPIANVFTSIRPTVLSLSMHMVIQVLAIIVATVRPFVSTLSVLDTFLEFSFEFTTVLLGLLTIAVVFIKLPFALICKSVYAC